MKKIVFILTLTIITSLSCQEKVISSDPKSDITSALYDTYDTYKEPSLNKRRIKHNDIQALIQQFKN